jgi:hypothetical protein
MKAVTESKSATASGEICDESYQKLRLRTLNDNEVLYWLGLVGKASCIGLMQNSLQTYVNRKILEIARYH